MSNDHQPLSGDTNHVHWSEDDIANVIAALQSGEASREVRAQSDAYVFLLHSKHVLKLTVFDRLSVDTEGPLPMSNEHEPVSGDSDVVQLSEQMSEQEIADLVAAIEDFEASYEPCAESNSYVLLLHSKHVLKLAVFDRSHNNTEDSLRTIDDTLLAGPADVHVDR
jgi:hypothetical protein